MKHGAVALIFFLGLIVPFTDSNGQQRLYAGADVVPLALNLEEGWTGASIGLQGGYFGDEYSFIEIEGRGGLYGAAQVTSAPDPATRYTAVFTSVGLKVGAGSSYRSKIRIYGYLGADVYFFGALKDFSVDLGGGTSPSYTFHPQKYPANIGIGLYVVGLRLVAPAGPLQLVVSLKGPSILRRQLRGFGPLPPESFFSLAVGAQF